MPSGWKSATVLPKPTQVEDTLADCARTGLTLGMHSKAQIRDWLRAPLCTDSRTLRKKVIRNVKIVINRPILLSRPP